MSRVSKGWDAKAHLRICATAYLHKNYLRSRSTARPLKGPTWKSMLEGFEEGVDMFTACRRAPIERIAIDNPEMNDLAKDRIPADLPAPQIVQPFWFGEATYKATGFYPRGLPQLVATNMLREPERGSDEWKAWSAIQRAPPGPDRWRIRSRTSQGVAAASADQWGCNVVKLQRAIQ